MIVIAGRIARLESEVMTPIPTGRYACELLPAIAVDL
jgi:hypothetical protein